MPVATGESLCGSYGTGCLNFYSLQGYPVWEQFGVMPVSVASSEWYSGRVVLYGFSCIFSGVMIYSGHYLSGPESHFFS